MKWLRKFENFTDDDYQLEIDYLNDSFLDLSDEYNLIEISKDDHRLKPSYNFKIDENCYFTYYYMGGSYRTWPTSIDKNELMFRFKIYLQINEISEFDVFKLSNDEIKKLIKQKYPNILKDLNNWVNQSKNKLSEMGNQVEQSFYFGFKRAWPSDDSESIPFVYIDIDFNILSENLKERFKYKNITEEEIRDCIKSGGYIFAKIVKGFPDNDPNNPLKAIDIDNDGLITVEHKGQIYEVDLKDVDKVDVKTNESREVDMAKEILEYRMKSKAIRENLSKLKLYYYEYPITYLIDYVDDKKLEEINQDLLLTKDKMDDIETLIEDISDRNKKEIVAELFCVKPYGNLSKLVEINAMKQADESGKLRRNDLNLVTDLNDEKAQFGILIEGLSKKIPFSEIQTFVNYNELKSQIDLIDYIKQNYSDVQIVLSKSSQNIRGNSSTDFIIFFKSSY